VDGFDQAIYRRDSENSENTRHVQRKLIFGSVVYTPGGEVKFDSRDENIIFSSSQIIAYLIVNLEGGAVHPNYPISCGVIGTY